MEDRDTVVIEAPEDEDANVLDPGPPPNDKAWKPFADLFPAGEDDGSYELACSIASGIVRKERRLAGIRAAWQKRKARVYRALEKLGERLADLEAGEKKACAEIEGQREFQIGRLLAAAQTDRFAKAWGMGKRAKNVTLATDAGPYTLSWKSSADVPVWALNEQGKTDEEAIIRSLNDRLSELGLFETVGAFVETKEKLRSADLKASLVRDGDDLWLAVVTEELTEAIIEEEQAGGLKYEPFTRNSEGLPVSWKVLVPAYVEDKLDGQVVRRRKLMTWEPPAIPVKVKFGPANVKTNGTVETEEDEQEDETDGDR